MHKKGSEISNASGLSRLPLLLKLKEVPIPGELVILMEHSQNGPVTATNNDPQR